MLKIFKNQKGMTLKELMVVLVIMISMILSSIPLFNYIKSHSPYQIEKEDHQANETVVTTHESSLDIFNDNQ